MGISAEGIQREMSATLDSAALCRANGAKPLAIPNTAILKLAVLLTGKSKFPNVTGQLYPSRQAILGGILPSLRDVITRETRCKEKDAIETTVTDFSNDPDQGDGNDYYCKLCSAELANEYFQCHGCLIRLNEEFNICFDCDDKEAYCQEIPMRPLTEENKGNPHYHHIARTVEEEDECTKECRKPNYCNNCCHNIFVRHLRHYSDECVNELITKCEALLEDLVQVGDAEVGDVVGDAEVPDAGFGHPKVGDEAV